MNPDQARLLSEAPHSEAIAPSWFEPQEHGIERALVDRQEIAADLLDGAGDAGILYQCDLTWDPERDR